MRLRPSPRAASVLLALALAAGQARADAIRLVAADAKGVTLELPVQYRLEKSGEDEASGRMRLVSPGLGAQGRPGRPILPAATTLIALPPGARAVVAAVQGNEEVHEGVRIILGEKRGFTDDPGGLGAVPTSTPVEPILDGPWPVTPVEVGAPFTLRGQRMVAVRLQPFRYDDASARLWVRRDMRVRVDFTGGGSSPSLAAPAAEDRHWDPVLRASVLNFEQGRPWRTAPGAETARSSTLLGRLPGARRAGQAQQGGFDESDAEVRIQLDTTGVYGITYDQLAAKGYPAGVPIAEVSLHRHEFVEDAVPAYETIELPIEVEDVQSNGIFDSGDRIVCFVESWAERSGASLPQRIWGDGEVVYATRVARGGLRIGTRSGALRQAGLTPLPSYPWTQRWEKNLAYGAFPGDAPAESLFDQFDWTTTIPYYSPPDVALFETNDLDVNRDASFTIAWQGRKSGMSYVTYAQVRDADYVFSVIADSVVWSGKGNQIVTATLPGFQLSEGLNNALVQWGRNGTGPPDRTTNPFANAGLNWFEATYWRSYKALNDYLLCNSGDAAGEYEVVASGFSNSAGLRAYDVTDPLDPRLMTSTLVQPGGAFALRFQDSTATGSPRRYIVFSRPRAVPAARITTVPQPRRQLAEMTSGDYLLVTPEAFLGPAQTLATLRETPFLHVAMSPLESIFDEFGGGRRSSFALKRYIRFALNHWQAKFVLLLGDGSVDPQNFIGDSGPDLVPVAEIPGPVAVADGREIVPSDGWYVWCLNGCGPTDPILPELFIGRLPATTVQEATDMVAKLVTYENRSVDQTWRNDLLLFSDDEFSAATTFGGGGPNTVSYCHRFYEDRFRLLSETIRSAIVDSAGLRASNVEQFDLGYWLRNEPVDVNDCRPDEITTQNNTRSTVTPALFTRLNAGRMWWNYQGHANEQVLAHENFYRNLPGEDDKDLLTNIDKPFLFSAFSCHVNSFAHVAERRSSVGPPIGEDLVLLPRRGSIGSYASVGYEIIPDNGTDHINVAWARAMFLDPPHDDLFNNGDLGARTLLGETIALGYMRFVPTVPFDPTENGVALTYTLLGDPATQLSIGAPQMLVTANGDTVVNGRPIALAAPFDTLHLEADLVSTVEIRSIALIQYGSGGVRTLPETTYTLTPPFPDTTVAGNGGRRYHLSFTTPLTTGIDRFVIHIQDRYGLANDFAVVMPFFTQLRVAGNVMAENDAVTPDAALSLKVVIPIPITDPLTQMSVALDSIPLPQFQAVALDTTSRQWLLTWAHAPYAAGPHVVRFTAQGTLRHDHHFRVLDPLAAGGRLLRDVLAFPNPFEEQLGTTFSMYVLADQPADVVLRVFSISGHVLYERVEHGVSPGYHQWSWDGRDSRGDAIANGIYLFKVAAAADSRHDSVDGRLVKLRRPRRGDVPTPQ
jgi:hypothetical protein